MKQHKRGRRITAVILAIAMMLAMVPAMAFAEESGGQDGASRALTIVNVNSEIGMKWSGTYYVDLEDEGTSVSLDTPMELGSEDGNYVDFSITGCNDEYTLKGFEINGTLYTEAGKLTLDSINKGSVRISLGDMKGGLQIEGVDLNTNITVVPVFERIDRAVIAIDLEKADADTKTKVVWGNDSSSKASAYTEPVKYSADNTNIFHIMNLRDNAVSKLEYISVKGTKSKETVFTQKDFDNAPSTPTAMFPVKRLYFTLDWEASGEKLAYAEYTPTLQTYKIYFDKKITKINEDVTVTAHLQNIPEFTAKKSETLDKIKAYGDQMDQYSAENQKLLKAAIKVGTQAIENAEYEADLEPAVRYATLAVEGVKTKAQEEEQAQEKTEKAGLAVKGIKAQAAGAQAVKISWAGVKNASGYRVYRAAEKNGAYSLLTTTKGTSVTNQKLTAGKIYYYKVRAYKTSGGKTITGSYSGVVSAKPVPNTATGVKAKAVGKKAIRVSWKKSGEASGYVVYRATKKSGAYKAVKTIKSASSTTFTNKKLKSKQTYYYKVRTYKTVSGKKIYGAYSAFAKAKAK